MTTMGDEAAAVPDVVTDADGTSGLGFQATADITSGDLHEADGSQSVSLGAETTGEEARRLAEQLLEHRFKDLIIDAGDVQRIDTPCLEILVSAAHRWSADGRRIEYRNGSTAFQHCLEALGLSLSALEVVENA